MPACRIAPPKRCFIRRAGTISSADPATTAPSGHPRPFERQSVTVSKRRPYSAAATPVATDALSSRAPSRWTRMPSSRAVATSASTSSSGHTRPPERRPHLVWREAAGDRRKAARDEAGVHRRPPELGEQQVRVLLGEQLVARPRLDPQRDLVRHRGRRQEDGLLLTEQRSGAALELEHRRVLALLLVADLRARDRLAHRRRRPRRRVGAQVDHGGSLATDSRARPPPGDLDVAAPRLP